MATATYYDVYLVDYNDGLEDCEGRASTSLCTFGTLDEAMTAFNTLLDLMRNDTSADCLAVWDGTKDICRYDFEYEKFVIKDGEQV